MAGPPPLSPVSGTVLVVDDEADILSSIQLLIESSLPGVKVRVADSGAKGLEMLRREPADLVISDYRMPAMDGIEFLTRAQEVAPRAARVLLTAFPKLELAIQAINEVNVNRFLTKPIEPDVLLDVVRSLLARLRGAPPPAAGTPAGWIPPPVRR